MKSCKDWIMTKTRQKEIGLDKLQISCNMTYGPRDSWIDTGSLVPTLCFRPFIRNSRNTIYLFC